MNYKQLGLTLHIKNMICLRCKLVVQSVLQAFGVTYYSLELGTVKLVKELSDEQTIQLDKALKRYGLELMDDRNKILVERIKTELINLLRAPNEMHWKLSVHLSKATGYNYTYLANTFSEWEGCTLEKYFIIQRVERVKEMIVYENFSVTKIAGELGYSSVSHLCLQFKKITGLTPAEFRKLCQSDDFVWRVV